jgi:NadR type nicotinamide-nucleotide adenylyltransferase
LPLQDYILGCKKQNMQNLRKVVIIGPESTGKSSLCKLLAEHYNTEWCPEFARDYLLYHGKNYSYDDLETIAKGQIELEEKVALIVQGAPQNLADNQTAKKLLFVDTDMYVMKVWCEYVFGKCHQLILDEIVTRKYDLYLLCNTDLPWKQDELREYPDEQPRLELFNIYKDILIHQNVPWVQINGDYAERLQTAIETINETFAIH